MKIDTFITETERESCRRVADAFSELYELLGDMAVADGGSVGYILLRYYNGYEFDSNEIYTDSKELFKELWKEWLEYHLLTPVLGTQLAELDYDMLYEILPNEKKEALDREKRAFWRASFGNQLSNEML